VPDHHDTAWWKIALAALLLLVVIASVWYSRQPKTADQLYRQIAVHANSDDLLLLNQAAQDIQQFEARFPADPRRDKVSALREQVELAKLDHQLRRLASRPQSAALDRPPVEQLYVEAIRARPFSPETAAFQLEALTQLFDGDSSPTPDARRCVVLAKRELEQLRAELEAARAVHRKFIQSRLDAARQLAPEDRTAALEIWQGIVRLYAEKPWAAELVQEARNSLSADDDAH
jgi:hypothetical protein